MPSFDPERKRVVLRVVYDGPGHAGKTTNLQRLCRSFASWRRSDLVSPNTIGERTQYFDWLEVDGGVSMSYPVRAQLLTVPGQIELAMRRQFVIERADVVVFVSDSQPDAVAAARPFYAQLCAQLATFEGPPVPIVFQANKQDVRGALPARKLAAAVCEGQTKPAMVKAAVATTGRGVKQTLAVALRLASERTRSLWRGRDPRAEVGEITNPEATLAAMEHSETQRAQGRAEVLTPVLPHADLPSKQLWPSASARALIRGLSGPEASKLRRVHFADHPERYCLETTYGGQPWQLLTRSAWAFPSLERAELALRQLVGRKLALASWLPEPSAAAVVADPGGAAWMWMIAPRLPSLATGLANPGVERQREALYRFAEVIVGAVALHERHGLAVTLDPRQFGEQYDERPRVRYLGHETRAEEALDVAGPALELVGRFARDAVALADYAELLCRGFHQVPQDPQRRLELREHFLAAPLPCAAAAPLRDSIALVLRRPASALPGDGGA